MDRRRAGWTRTDEDGKVTGRCIDSGMNRRGRHQASVQSWQGDGGEFDSLQTMSINIIGRAVWANRQADCSG